MEEIFLEKLPVARLLNNLPHLIFYNPLLFASCTNTFSKCCEITTTTGMKRSAQ
jgi:hypothetical protein